MRERGWTLERIATDVGIINAAPQPCTTREPIIHGMSWASPASAVATATALRAGQEDPAQPQEIAEAAAEHHERGERRDVGR